MTDINTFSSECEKNQRIVVCQDTGTCKYTANNKKSKLIAKYTIDNNVIKDGKRCDFLVLNNTDKDAFFIEVKGSDIEYAIKQIEATEKELQLSTLGYNAFYRIVYKTGTHDVNSSKVMNWKKNCGVKNGRKRAIVKRLKYDEDI